MTAYNALYGIPSEQLRAGDTVVAQGTGGVSVFALQLAAAAGAQTVITSSSDEKLEKVKQLVPESLRHLVHTVNYKTNPDWDKKVLEVTDGRGADHVVEVGGPGTLEKSFSAIKRGGVVSTIGFVAAGTPPNVAALALVKSAYFVSKTRMISQSLCSRLTSTFTTTQRGLLVGSKEQFEHMNKIFDFHKIVPLVDKVFPFEEAQKAYEYQWSQAHAGKVVIKVA